MKSIFTKEQIEFLKNNYDKMAYSEIAKLFNLTERQVRGKINGMGLTKRRKFNSSYFHTINTPNQAYWLGFIYADGYIVKGKERRSHELGIELKDTDSELLFAFNQEIGNVHNIVFKHKYKQFNGYTYETDSCILRIYSAEIVEDLILKNVMPNKTNKPEFPVCNNLFWDFLRGFMDGDGCIYVNPKNRISLKFVNSNVEFLHYLKSTIQSKLNVMGSIYKESDKKYQLVYFNQSTIKEVLNAIYYNLNNQFLKRKYEIYKSYYGSPS